MVSTQLNDADWRQLVEQVRSQERALVMNCCGNPARPRVSPLGLRHFYHYRPARHTGVRCSAPAESPQHLALKAQLVELLQEQGWQAEPEVRGTDWRADVLATQGDLRVAWEVQLGSQDATTTRRRHQRYQRDGIRCVWLMRHPPALPSTADIPIFGLIHREDEWQATLPRGDFNRPRWLPSIPLEELVTALCQRRLAYRPPSVPGTIQAGVVYLELPCWNCRRLMPIVLADTEEYLCRCGEYPMYLGTEELGSQLNHILQDARLPRQPVLQYRYLPSERRWAWVNCCVHCNRASIERAMPFIGHTYFLEAAREGRKFIPGAPTRNWYYLGEWELVFSGHPRDWQYQSHHWCLQPATAPAAT